MSFLFRNPTGEGRPAGHHCDSETIAEQAAAWVARRDRGLTAAEAAELAAWEAADPRHAAELAHFSQSWRDLGDIASVPTLAAEARALDAATAVRQKWRRFGWVGAGLAAAAAIAVLAMRPGREAPRSAEVATVAPAAVAGAFLEMPGTARHVVLPDGSAVELNGHSRIEHDFSPVLRRVRLVHGEAHFAVAQDSARPFVVEVEGVEIRAVGTAFNVRRGTTGLEVLVTEGKVQLAGQVAGAPLPPRPVEAGQRAVVALPGAVAPAEGGRGSEAVVVSSVTMAEITDSLAWQGTRLVFDRLPLPQVIEAFNRHNPRRLRLGEAALQPRRISGIFRADNLDGFVRLLGEAFDIAAEPVGEWEIVLRPAR